MPLGNDLADHNTVGSAAGQIGRAADFEARDEEFLSISDTLQSGLDVTGSLTLVGWMNPESLPSPQILAGKYEWGCTNRAYRFDFREGDTLPRPTRPLAPVPRSRRTTGFARCECPLPHGNLHPCPLAQGIGRHDFIARPHVERLE